MQQSGDFCIFNVRFRVVRHAVDQLTLEKFGIEPIADSDDLEDLTFVATSWKAKAAVQIAGSISLNWRAPVLADIGLLDMLARYPTLTCVYACQQCGSDLENHCTRFRERV